MAWARASSSNANVVRVQDREQATSRRRRESRTRATCIRAREAALRSRRRQRSRRWQLAASSPESSAAPTGASTRRTTSGPANLVGNISLERPRSSATARSSACSAPVLVECAAHARRGTRPVSGALERRSSLGRDSNEPLAAPESRATARNRDGRRGVPRVGVHAPLLAAREACLGARNPRAPHHVVLAVRRRSTRARGGPRKLLTLGRRRLALLAVASLLIGSNWGMYIWGVNSGTSSKRRSGTSSIRPSRSCSASSSCASRCDRRSGWRSPS